MQPSTVPTSTLKALNTLNPDELWSLAREAEYRLAAGMDWLDETTHMERMIRMASAVSLIEEETKVVSYLVALQQVVASAA